MACRIHQHSASSPSCEEPCWNAYNFVLHQHGELAYNGVQGVDTEHLKSVAPSCAYCPGDWLLEELEKQLEDG